MFDCGLTNQNARLTLVFDQSKCTFDCVLTNQNGITIINTRQTLVLLLDIVFHYCLQCIVVLVTLPSLSGSTTKNNSFQWLLSWLLHK